MDDLDRLFRRVVHNVRAAYPELLTQSFEVSQLYQQVVPYRLNRRELGVATVEDYELALMQLLAGARGYLTGDADMQRALQDELEAPNPDLSAYRGYATSHVAISEEAVRALDQQALVPAGSAAPAGESATLAARATEPIVRGASAAEPRQAPPPPPTSAAMPMERTPASGVPSRSEDASAGNCRYCGGTLPDGKPIVFCPYCGHDLTVQNCPACNTELEIGWRFCITCGRQVS